MRKAATFYALVLAVCVVALAAPVAGRFLPQQPQEPKTPVKTPVKKPVKTPIKLPPGGILKPADTEEADSVGSQSGTGEEQGQTEHKTKAKKSKPDHSEETKTGE